MFLTIFYIYSNTMTTKKVILFKILIINYFYLLLYNNFYVIIGPLILYIGGEGEAYPAGGFTLKIAKQFKGIVATLEHRFYGESQPFGKNENSYSIENLKFLTHEQALEDLANFIGYLKDSGKYGIH